MMELATPALAEQSYSRCVDVNVGKNNVLTNSSSELATGRTIWHMVSSKIGKASCNFHQLSRGEGIPEKGMFGVTVLGPSKTITDRRILGIIGIKDGGSWD